MIEMFSSSWSNFKNTTITKKSLLLQYSETSTNYEVYASDGPFIWTYSILKDGGSDQTDFETNYKAKINLKIGNGESQPFSIPSYRTKRDAIAAPITCPKNTTTEILYPLTQELYTKGGCMIVKNPEFGDYVFAEVEDIDGVIPAPYRAAICEAWPVVAVYILKEFVEVNGSSLVVHRIDTQPLSAKITPGLYLSLHYVAVNAGLDREVAINYYMNKKL